MKQNPNESENQFINGCPIKWFKWRTVPSSFVGKINTSSHCRQAAPGGVEWCHRPGELHWCCSPWTTPVFFAASRAKKPNRALETNTEGTREDSWNLVLVSKKMIVHVHISWRKSRRCWGLQLDPSKHVGFNFGQLVYPGPHGLDRFDLQLLLQQFCISNAPHVFSAPMPSVRWYFQRPSSIGILPQVMLSSIVPMTTTVAWKRGLNLTPLDFRSFWLLANHPLRAESAFKMINMPCTSRHKSSLSFSLNTSPFVSLLSLFLCV